MNVAPFVDRGESYLADRAFPRASSLLGAFDTVLDRIAHQVKERFGDCVDDCFVDADVAAFDLKFNLPSELARGDTTSARRNSLKNFAARHQAQLDQSFLQFDKSASQGHGNSIGRIGGL